MYRIFNLKEKSTIPHDLIKLLSERIFKPDLEIGCFEWCLDASNQFIIVR